MDRKRWTAVLIVVVVLVLLGLAGGVYYFFFRPGTVSVENGDVPTAEQELERSLPSVVIQQEEETAEVRAFYLDCKQASFNKDSFFTQLQVKAPEFYKMRVSLGSQPVFGSEGQTEEVFTSAPDALFKLGDQFTIDPRVLATLIELESGGLTNPFYHQRFPLLYPDVPDQRDEFQIQVGIASDAIKKIKDELQSDPQLVEEQSLTSQAVLRYLAGKGYTVARVEDFIRSGAGSNFIGVFRSFFETDPRVCRN